MTVPAEDFIFRLKNNLPTFEHTGEKDAITNLYFDIDDSREHTPDEQKDMLESYIALLQDTFGSDIKWSVLSAHGQTKTSFHIHTPELRARKCDIAHYVKQMNHSLKTEFAILDLAPFDDAVYSSNRYMRCHGTSKDGQRPFVLEQGEIEHTVITLEYPNARVLEQIAQDQSPTCENPAVYSVQLSSDVKLNMMNLFIERKLLEVQANSPYAEWIKIAFAIYNTFGPGDEGFDIFARYSRLSKKAPSNMELYEKWNRMGATRKSPVSFGTICYEAKKSDPAAYRQIIDATRPIKPNDNEHLLVKGTEISLATYANEKWGDQIKWCEKTIYVFQNALWNEDENHAIIDKFLNKMQDDIEVCRKNNITLKERLGDETATKKYDVAIKALEKTDAKLGSTRTRANIVSQIGKLRTDIEFKRSLNRQEYILPLPNCRVIDIRTLKITDRDSTHKFTYECGADLIDMTPEQHTEIDTYFNQMFIHENTTDTDFETKQCFLDIIKSCFAGQTLRYIYFMVGEGKNGKSLLLEIIRKIFNRACDTISKDIIIKSKANSQLTTHLEKLDSGLRVGFTSELERTDELNQTVIKQITGGDAIDHRGLHKTNTTIIPTANLFAITNELAKFKPEPATMARLINIPFFATFEDNTEFAKHMKSQQMLDCIFTYIMQQGILRTRFECSEAMLNSKEKYIDENSKSHLSDFIEEMCEVAEDLEVPRNEFIAQFNQWLMSKGLKTDRRDYNNFTRAMKRLGYGNKSSNNICKYIGLAIIPTTKGEYYPPNPWT